MVKLTISLHTCPATSNQALQASFLGFTGFDSRCLHPGWRCSWVALRALRMPGKNCVSSSLGCGSFSWPVQRNAGANAATFPSRERYRVPIFVPRAPFAEPAGTCLYSYATMTRGGKMHGSEFLSWVFYVAFDHGHSGVTTC